MFENFIETITCNNRKLKWNISSKPNSEEKLTRNFLCVKDVYLQITVLNPMSKKFEWAEFQTSPKMLMVCGLSPSGDSVMAAISSFMWWAITI